MNDEDIAVTQSACFGNCWILDWFWQIKLYSQCCFLHILALVENNCICFELPCVTKCLSVLAYICIMIIVTYEWYTYVFSLSLGPEREVDTRTERGECQTTRPPRSTRGEYKSKGLSKVNKNPQRSSPHPSSGTYPSNQFCLNPHVHGQNTQITMNNNF